jgi:hypothetical protein
VAQDELGVAGRDAKVFEQCGRSVPQVVKLDCAYAAGLADAVAGPDEVARLDWPPVFVVKASPLPTQARPKRGR